MCVGGFQGHQPYNYAHSDQVYMPKCKLHTTRSLYARQALMLYTRPLFVHNPSTINLRTQPRCFCWSRDITKDNQPYHGSFLVKIASIICWSKPSAKLFCFLREEESRPTPSIIMPDISLPKVKKPSKCKLCFLRCFACCCPCMKPRLPGQKKKCCCC